ncbi:MAG: hypothetical protein JXB25_12900 [Deltaproteobacteria bacterium]|nr:hypothetical protein [Deltaproteobacteria bacterium]
MGLKLGEMLVREKIITAAQLEEALRNQLLYGGKIGVNLIELGFARQEEIAHMLSRKLRLPFVDPERLNHVPPQIVDLIPREMAAKYSIVPIELNNKKLTLAMADPTDLQSIDEIAFRTGFIVLPVVTPELSLTYAMKRYYQLERVVHDDLGQTPGDVKRDESGKPVPIPVGISREPFRVVGNNALPVAGGTRQPEPLWEQREILSPAVFSQMLAEASDRDVVARLLTRFAAQDFKKVALFAVRGEEAAGWAAVVDGVALKTFAEVKIPLQDKSALKILVDGKKTHVGLIPFSVPNSQLLNAVQGSFQETVVLVPLLILGRTVAVLFAAGAGTSSQESLQALRTAAAKAAMALEILVLRKKIMMV